MKLVFIKQPNFLIIIQIEEKMFQIVINSQSPIIIDFVLSILFLNNKIFI